ncbi:helix-turn-helix domain-containing protein [Halomonas sp. V046]|uniref:helix-turn-helix domain-containing protein n=1 Tax=Halomonas sp. V046 TaxID=3459611 RepID=UPI00404445DB
MPEGKTVADRLAQALAGRGWSENELARQSGVPQPTIHRIITGESKSPRTGNLEKLANALGISIVQLTYGSAVGQAYDSSPKPGDALEAAGQVGDTVRGHSNVQTAPHPIRYHRYPVISRVQAGAWTECVTPYEPGAEPHEEASDYRAQGKAFWLEVKGDSMTAPPGSTPSIPEGTLVLFDSGIDAVPGKLVAALLSDNNEATFKKLIEDGGQRFLKALNPAYPLIPINGNCRILGVAVEAKTRL